MILLEKNDDLTRKLGVFMGDPTPGGEDEMPRTFAQRTTSSSTTPTQTPTIVMMTMLMKLERTSWSLLPIKTSSRPPYQ